MFSFVYSCGVTYIVKLCVYGREVICHFEVGDTGKAAVEWEEQVQRLEKQVAELTHETTELREESRQLRLEQETLNNEKQELSTQLEQLREEATQQPCATKAAASEHVDGFPSEAAAAKAAAKAATAEVKRLTAQVEGLTEEVSQKTKALMEQGEKNYQLYDSLQRYKEESGDAGAALKEARTLLLQELAGEDALTNDYQNVNLLELIRLFINKSSPLDTHLTQSLRTASKISSAAEDTDEVPSGDAPPSVQRFFELDAECKLLKSNQRKMQKEMDRLKKQGTRGNDALQEVQTCRQRVEDLAQKLQTQKAMKARAEQELVKSNKRIQTLSAHIEKLMIHLKHEASAKIKAQDDQRQQQAETVGLKQKVAALQKKARSRAKLVHELKEGSRILEDQLRLMDQKYVDLRTKLDWTRASSNKEVKRIQKEANKLRAKFSIALANGALAGSMMQDIDHFTKPNHVEAVIEDLPEHFPEQKVDQGVESGGVSDDPEANIDSEFDEEAQRLESGGFKSTSLASFESIANTYSADGQKKTAGEILPAIDTILPKSASERYQPRE